MDRHHFTKRIAIGSTVESVYRALATGKGLESWFLRQAAFTTSSGRLRYGEEGIEKGDSYEWLWYGCSDDTVERKRVLEANGRNHLKFTFSGDSVVDIIIKPQQKLTLVELQQHIPESQDPNFELRIGCDTGWTFYLTNLKSVLEGGLDLRNRDVLLKNVINS
jgi:uncharacterized protein YndB with AHSA1/START domain